jgi:hypothetical protein
MSKKCHCPYFIVSIYSRRRSDHHMLHDELPPCSPSSHFGFIQFLFVPLGEAGATPTDMSETSEE